ncbi:hypothetical protein Asp14428_33660 [Actinoplanes sp. NBRC 14428]|uniref:Lasso RiPP family leader peptide-containing protein n=1 Tax=Pseudosporangium ferrugineum TaxID=439699 RepID=A0A2T0RIL0_9ACTN|nr:lasso RiPP family leader peptide-containing protein [Pseudosporangium ferrugineum]PRY21023.1 hypothetical protein CLV70_12124 [Pseudosporangium ferrugineum]BCJ51891.1 hypothetical protein Asp14428_33660 [Actinoplanes sp. NBRC 14428]
MTQLCEQVRRDAYKPPALEPLGSLRSLTRGAGPDGELVVTVTGGGIPGGVFDDSDARAVLV